MKVIKRLYFAILIILGTWQVNAQILTPVEWSTNFDGKYLEAIATLEPGWHLYSQYNDDFPFPTKFTFDTTSFLDNNNPVISFSDPNYFQEPPAITEFVKEFDMELSFFKNKVVFRQEIDKQNAQELILEAEVEFIVCNDEMCLPPDYLKLKWIIPATDEILLNSRSIESDDKTNINPDDLISTSEMTEKKTIIRDSKISDSLLGIFGEGMFWGFFAIIMPCIFPMIPLTVSFFMKQSKSRS